MKTIFDAPVLYEILDRIGSLQPASPRQWGTMNPPQMLAHCSAVLEMANGTKVPPRVFIGRIFGPLAKPSAFGEKPFRHNNPTDKTFIVTNNRDFAGEKDRLLGLVGSFGRAGEDGCTEHTHAFFGTLTPKEWGILTYKHIDHHLRQFGC